MSATGERIATSTRATVLALEPDPVLAFLHLPEATARRGSAVLICPPFGWEETCSYRARRVWAQMLAESGYPAARFDLPGSGDSGGSAWEGRLDAWTDAVSGAAGWLREATGCGRVIGLGIGLGGILATRAHATGGPLDDLVLWGVPARGRTVVRELRAYAAVIEATSARELGGPQLPSGALALAGYVLSGDRARALEQLDLTEFPVPSAGTLRVLLLGRNGLRADERLRTHFSAAGAALTLGHGSDYDALMAHPQETRSPQETIIESIAWLAASPPAPRERSAAPPAVERETMELIAEGRPVRETPLCLRGESGRVFGVLCEPADGVIAPISGVLLNAGALRHTGPNRSYVELARRWAARGVPTTRIDLAGLGDSDGEPALALDSGLYAPGRINETLMLLDQLAARGVPNRFVLGGLCSAAYWALHAALADPRVVGALMINLYVFEWSQALVEERETYATLAALRGTRSWRALSRGDVSAVKMRATIRSIRPDRLPTTKHHPVEQAQTELVERRLLQLRDQGTELLLLFSDGEPLRDQLARQGVLGTLERWPNLHVERIPSRDHMFRSVALQRLVHQSMDSALTRVLDRAEHASGRRNSLA